MVEPEEGELADEKKATEGVELNEAVVDHVRPLMITWGEVKEWSYCSPWNLYY